jgi:hypothetical protein
MVKLGKHIDDLATMNIADIYLLYRRYQVRNKSIDVKKSVFRLTCIGGIQQQEQEERLIIFFIGMKSSMYFII